MENNIIDLTMCPFCKSYATGQIGGDDESETRKCDNCGETYIVWYEADGETVAEICDRHNRKLEV